MITALLTVGFVCGTGQRHDGALWGFLLFLVIIAGLAFASKGLEALFTPQPPKPGHCPHCQYDLAGLAASVRCPECGVVRDEADCRSN